MADRKSEAEIPALITDPIALAKKEAENALLQFDWAMEEVERWIAKSEPKFRISTLLDLHRKAMDGIDPYAGNFRPAAVAIRGSSHNPVAGEDVPRYVEEMLEYLTDNWSKKTAIHLAAYAMWRLNWIHPFADGNGRTSRMLSYMVLCGNLGQVLPGSRTIPEQISENKKPYYDALELADNMYKKGSVNVQEMERLLEGYLAAQLVVIHDRATGSKATEVKAESSSKSKNPVPSPKQGIVKTIESHPVISGGIFLVVVTLFSLLFS